ncbi:MAG TPA: hypothetical protein VGG06_02220 [Thermoanaerobaculia bacterium]
MKRSAVPWVLFFTLFTAYAYFHQGGGWNQNSRFDQVRSLAEEGSWAINRFAVYRVRADRGGLERVPLPERIPRLNVARYNTLDLAFVDGRLYPNKPPGVTLLALPAYAALWRVERLLGVDPDAWRPLTANLYLVTALSIGVAGALAGVVLLSLSRRLHPGLDERWHVAAALACGLGTMLLPFSTMLFDHAAAAAAALGAFLLVVEACDERRGRRRRLAAAGLVLGLGVLISYAVALVLPLIALYAAIRLGRGAAALGFLAAGGVLPALFHLWYHWHQLGSPWTIANTVQIGIFGQSEERLLGVFGVPDLGVLGELLIGRRRGLFSSSPVLVLALFGVYEACRRRRLEVGVSLGVAVVYLTMNSSFNLWASGDSFGPRYLVPAVPFLALFLAPAFARWPRAGAALAVASVAVALAATAADPLIPPEVERPMLDHVLPGFLGPDPVSRNPAGVYEAIPYDAFRPGSPPVRWNSFNLGELLFPHSVLSLAPLVALLAGASWWLLRRPRVEDPPSAFAVCAVPAASLDP